MAKLVKKQTFNLTPGNNGLDVKSCVVCGDRLLFADKKNNRIVIHRIDGSFDTELPLSSEPFDIAVVDVNQIIISYGRSKFIDILNLNSKETKKIQLEGNCWGVHYYNDKIYVVVDRQGIVILSLEGANTGEIKIREEWDQATYITVTDEKIYLTVFVPANIICMDHMGSIQWNCKSVKQPRGITADKNGNIFVASFASHCIDCLKTNGENVTEIVNDNDGLSYPCGIYLDEHSNTLLICNLKDGRATLYDVLYN